MPNSLKQYRRELKLSFDEVRPLYVRLKVSVEGETHDVSDVLLKYRDLCLIGPAGSGKTTVFKHLAALLAESKEHPQAIFVPLRSIQGHLQQLSARSMVENFSSPTPPAELLDDLVSGAPAILLLDGLDEMLPSIYDQFKEAIQRWKTGWSGANWILSTRPHFADLVTDGTTLVELLPLDDSQVREYLNKRFQEPKPGFIKQSLERVTTLRTLSRNPLLLDLIGRLSEVIGVVPSSRTELYSSFVDVLLRSWDKSKGISPTTKHSSPEYLRSILAQLALHSLISKRSFIDISDIASIAPAGTVTDEQSTSQGLLRAFFLVRSEPTRYEFIHRSFQEYFAALAISELSIDKAAEVLGISSSDTLIEFVANLSEKPDALVSELADRGHMNLAFQLLDVLPPEQRLVRIDFLRQIAEHLGIPDAVIPSTSDRFERTPEFSRLWERCKTSPEPQKRGRYLEDFVERIFGEVFHIVSKDRLTDFGEVDLICEQRDISAFWGRWPSDFFVECKNHKDKSPVSDINEFIGKASNCCARLGFFVSMTGFSSFAVNSMKSSWGRPGLPDIVWITGDDLDKWIMRTEPVESFLKRICRRANWGRD